MTAEEFWNDVRPSGLTAEQELVAFWQRMRDCPCAGNKTPPMVAFGQAPTGGGQVSLSEWLRRYGPQQVDQVTVVEPLDRAKALRDAKRKRRIHEEDFLLNQS